MSTICSLFFKQYCINKKRKKKEKKRKKKKKYRRKGWGTKKKKNIVEKKKSGNGPNKWPSPMSSCHARQERNS
jgi:hypothetical protein